ncbi:MAG: extracellular solute-binding protein [Rhodobacteraceae bacterium]|nr:extracellular solute-binding protein [Paracoccaceae bacterium]
MRRWILRGALAVLGAALVAGSWTSARAEPRHGIAMYGEPALPPDFVSLPHANPDAPRGGRIVFGEGGSFDSLNPFILKGNAPYGVRIHTVETMMGRSYDEPFTLYCLLCESVEAPEDRSWVEFTLRPEARFSDGTPVTVEDVIWSYETVGTKGHPRFLTAWEKVASIEPVGERGVRITFSTKDRELPLIMGLRPVLKKAQWEGKAFDESSLEVPIGSGPYVIEAFEPGRYITFRRNPDYWGNALPFNRGQHNFEEIRYDYYGDTGVAFEAFKAGAVDVFREPNAAKWASAYDFPRVRSGAVLKAEIPHSRPSGLTGLVMNTRLPQFADWRVREAMIQAFNYEFISAQLNAGADPRSMSYFDNSPFAMGQGPAEGRVREILAAYADHLLPGALEGYTFPAGERGEANRAGIREAMRLMAEAGWTVQDGVMKDAAGQPFTFEIVLQQGSSEQAAIVDTYLEALARLGIRPTVTTIDSAQYTERINAYDFGMTWLSRVVSLSPGNEMRLYFGSNGVTEPGTRNWMGANSPAIDGLIDAMLAAPSQEEFTATVQALDRVLTSGRYIIPIWYAKVSRLAHDARLKYPERLPLYGDWPGFLPDVWWYEE